MSARGARKASCIGCSLNMGLQWVRAAPGRATRCRKMTGDRRSMVLGGKEEVVRAREIVRALSVHSLERLGNNAVGTT